ncbi:hypothetical protein [Helicobacter sp. 23-1045]
MGFFALDSANFFGRDSAIFCIFSVIARFDEVKSWQSILFFVDCFVALASLRAPRNDEVRTDSANFRIRFCDFRRI